MSAVGETPMRHARRLALYILTSLGPRLSPDVMDKRAFGTSLKYLRQTHFQPTSPGSFPPQRPLESSLASHPSMRTV